MEISYIQQTNNYFLRLGAVKLKLHDTSLPLATRYLGAFIIE